MDAGKKNDTQSQPDPQHKDACESMPDLTRLRYFNGQMMVANDLQAEQDYFRNKLKLLNRCLHGYGTVCGLKVVACKTDPDCYPQIKQQAGGQYAQQSPQQSGQQYGGQQQHVPALVQVECGLALDCEGNELIVRDRLTVNLLDELSDEDKRRIEDPQNTKKTLYLSICYCVQPIDPVRPVIPDACAAVSECVYSKLRDSVQIRVSTERPRVDHCRNNCCEQCKDKCLLLAAIDYTKGKEVTDEQIRNDVRRWGTLYKPVTINGISWVHGAENYTVEEARRMLQDEGLTVEFSRPVLEETITKGIFEVWVFEGGRGRDAGFYYIDGEVTLNNDRYLIFNQTSGETLQHGDRVMITVRTDFILDECCRPVDGNHIGGRVPLLKDFAHNVPDQGAPQARTKCIYPPNRYGMWTSGNGSPGGSFESWFYIYNPPDKGGQGTKKERGKKISPTVYDES